MGPRLSSQTDEKTPPIERLAALPGLASIDRDQIVRALYVLRMPRSFNGLTVIIERFFRLAESNPELFVCHDIEDYAHRIEHLRLIAQAAAEVPEFSGQKLNLNPLIQLYPYCGDSAISDLLLTMVEDGNLGHQAEFDRLVAWFVWQGIRFNLSTLKESAYLSYLLRPEARRICFGIGGQIYAAYLELRELAAFSTRDRLNKILALELRLDERSSFELTLISRLLKLSAPQKRRVLERYALEVHDFTTAGIIAKSEAFAALLSDKAPRFLKSHWLRQLEAQMGPSVPRRRQGQFHRVFKPQCRAFPTHHEELSLLHEEEVQSAVRLDIRPPNEMDPDESASEFETLEPRFSVVLFEKLDPIRAHFNCRSLQHHIEAANAYLPWPRWRLSRSAIRELYAMVQYNPVESVFIRRARLTLGLSLVSGRPIDEVGNVRVTDPEHHLNERRPVRIDFDNGELVVLAGSPRVKAPSAPADLRHPRAEELRLVLPAEWMELANSLRASTESELPKTREALSSILAEISSELSVTEKGISNAIWFRLMGLKQGDLALVKVITDSSEANLQNLIHYASFDRKKVEQWWRDAAQDLIGYPLCLPNHESDNEVRVGAIDAYRIDKLQEIFASLQWRFIEAVHQKDWVLAYNLMAMHLIHWAKLVCAGRKTAEPHLPKMSGDGWTLVDDKHRTDGSTDRLIPGTEAFQQQLHRFHEFARRLSLTRECLRDAEVIAQLVDAPRQRAKSPRSGELEALLGLPEIPGNWARKVIRSELQIPNRILESGLGHLIRGRHAWRLTSNLNGAHYLEQWQAAINELEEKLGFTVWDTRFDSKTEYRSMPLNIKKLKHESKS